MNKRYKIFDYCWHIPYQWDMIRALDDDCEFYYGLNVYTHWDITKRPLPPKIYFVIHYETGTFDVAVLHIDQTMVDINSQKRMVFDHFNRIITDTPKIVVNHGAPIYPEYYAMTELSISPEESEKRCKEAIRKLVGANVMVVNSHKASSADEWGFGVPIVHGMDADEWYDLPKEPRVFTALPPSGLDAYYNRKRMIEVSDILYDQYGYLLHYEELNVNVGHTPESYKNYLGKSLLYVDTSFRTPINCARTEAFLSGCCVIQVEGAHDLERWAKNGENIILVPDDPEKIAGVIADLLQNGYQKAIQIGQKGKEMAMREFNRERYRKDWLNLLNKLRIKS